MMDAKTWGYIKVLGGALAIYFIMKPAPTGWMNFDGAILILAALTLLGGAMKVTGKK